MSIFGNNKRTTIAVSVVLAALLIAFATTCRSEPVASFEAGSTMLRAPALGLGIVVAWPEAGPRDADFEVGLHLIDSSSFYSREQPRQAIAEALIVDGFGRIDIGLGGAWLQNVDDMNGSNANFALLLRWRATEHLSIAWRHWSNAGSKFPNYGRDLAAVSWKF